MSVDFEKIQREVMDELDDFIAPDGKEPAKRLIKQIASIATMASLKCIQKYEAQKQAAD